MRPLLTVLLLVPIVLIAFIILRREAKVPAPLGTKRTSENNPFGTMTGNVAYVPLAADLGVKYYRPLSISTTNWDGTCAECDAAITQGMSLILTVRNQSGQTPAAAPADLGSYMNVLTQIVTKYKPAILVIENEENSNLFYASTPSEYLAQLSAGCKAAHQAGIKCTNGGLVSELVVFMTAQDMLDKGQTSQADEFIKVTIGDKLESRYGMSQVDAAQLLALPAVVSQVNKGRALIAGYKKAGADYVNFHWYVADTTALSTAKKYVEAASGLSAITNEVGQQGNTDAAQVTAVMQKIVELKIPVAVWFSMDIQGFGGAKSLFDSNGTLRSNGEAFGNFISQNF